MTISVIYVAYRTTVEMLRKSIASVRAAADASHDELQIIVVDNGGASAYADELPATRIIGDGQNVGFGEAVNAAVREARGERVLLMNPDSVAHADLFIEFSRAAVRSPSGAMFGALLLKNGHPQVHAYNVWWSSLQLLWRRERWTRELNRICATGTPAQVRRLCGAGWFADRAALVALGPFDSTFFLYGEDVDLSLRARDRGHPLMLVPTAVIEHDAGTSSEGSSALVERARTDAHLRLVSRHRGYLASLLARAESVAATLAGALLARNPHARAARLARLTELRRWGLRRVADRFKPHEAA